MRVLACFALLLVLTLAGPAWAGKTPSCYSMREAEAEQGIRIHSELMVIGLNCQHMTPAGEKNLYSQYRELTSKYSDLFAGYEEILIDYYKRNGAANPVGSLNDLRTVFANTISYDAAKMRPDMFCKRYSERITQASKMDRATIRRWASTIYPSHPVSHPICEQ